MKRDGKAKWPALNMCRKPGRQQKGESGKHRWLLPPLSITWWKSSKSNSSVTLGSKFPTKRVRSASAAAAPISSLPRLAGWLAGGEDSEAPGRRRNGGGGEIGGRHTKEDDVRSSLNSAGAAKFRGFWRSPSVVVVMLKQNLCCFASSSLPSPNCNFHG